MKLNPKLHARSSLFVNLFNNLIFAGIIGSGRVLSDLVNELTLLLTEIVLTAIETIDIECVLLSFLSKKIVAAKWLIYKGIAVLVATSV